MTDLASRVYDHNWKIDPIVRSLIDTDFYKLLMAQSVFHNKPDTHVTFSLINRSTHIPLANMVDEGELREQLDHVRTLRLARGESTWLRGNMFYGKRAMFRPDFMEWFEGLTLPDYHLERVGDQYELSFEGPWPAVMLWEIPALAVLMELRSRAVLAGRNKFELQVLYARAMTKLWEKVEALQKLDNVRLADFGTRRRHSFLWQGLVCAGDAGGTGRKICRHVQLSDLPCGASWKRSGPMPTSCPWSMQRWLKGMRHWPKPPMPCLKTGRRSMKAIF